jgi:hypothetical protein
MRNNVVTIETFDPKQLDKTTYASYSQRITLIVFGKKVYCSVRMDSLVSSIFSEKLLSTYSQIMKNIDAEVMRVIKIAASEYEDGSASKMENQMKSNVDYVGIRIQDDAIKGKPDSIWHEISFAYKGNEHLFSLEGIDGKYDTVISMNG